MIVRAIGLPAVIALDVKMRRIESRIPEHLESIRPKTFIGIGVYVRTSTCC